MIRLALVYSIVMFMTIDNNAKHLFFLALWLGGGQEQARVQNTDTEYKIIMIRTVVEFSHLTIFTLDPNKDTHSFPS